ncbi:hypothetical protein G6F42_023737 [Rhizopus arrhizus]|nr:hypothetical protein G6F42_023737 [Rhizopus arrhizus]
MGLNKAAAMGNNGNGVTGNVPNGPMNNGNFRPGQPQQQQSPFTQPSDANAAIGSPMQQSAVTANYPNAMGNPGGALSASSTPVSVPATLASVQQQQKLQQQQQQFANMRPPPQSQQTSQQAQQMVNQEMLMQRMQQQQQQQQQAQAQAQHNMNGGPRPPLPPQQTPQFVSQQQQAQQQQQGLQRPMMPQQPMQMQMQPNGVLKPLTLQQRNSAAGIVKQMDEGVRQGRVRGPVIEDLSESDKMAIRDQISQMKSMYDKIDNLLPVFLAMTSNVEATRRLILMKYMFEDQLVALPQNKFFISLENLHKLREQFSGYFTWVRNAVGQQQQQQQQMNAMAGGNANPQQQQQQIGLGLLPMHMQQQQQQQHQP